MSLAKRKYIDRDFEVKASDVKADGTFTGHASVFDELDSHFDVVVKGAFEKSLKSDFLDKGRKVPMLWQHDPKQPIGVYSKIFEDEKGLYVEGEINMDVQKGQECHALLKQGAMSGLSIGYSTINDKWDDNGIVRRLLEVKLWEASPVTFPSGDAARVNDVKFMQELVTLADCESVLREHGLSRKESETFIARIKSISLQGDPASADVEAVKNAIAILRGH